MANKEKFSRTENLIGADNAAKLYRANVAVFGLGGVGGYVVEALARAGVGAMTIVDGDKISESNINRQIIALSSNVGEYKTEAFAKRIKDINSDCTVTVKTTFYTADNADEISFDGFDYVVDAIDTVSAKLLIIKRAKAVGVPVISAMGAGNKINAAFKIADISKTSGCPLARVMRRELKNAGISDVKVCFSDEPVVAENAKNEITGKPIPASISFIPPAMGLMIAGEVIRYIIG